MGRTVVPAARTAETGALRPVPEPVTPVTSALMAGVRDLPSIGWSTPGPVSRQPHSTGRRAIRVTLNQVWSDLGAWAGRVPRGPAADGVPARSVGPRGGWPDSLDDDPPRRGRHHTA